MNDFNVSFRKLFFFVKEMRERKIFFIHIFKRWPVNTPSGEFLSKLPASSLFLRSVHRTFLSE